MKKTTILYDLLHSGIPYEDIWQAILQHNPHDKEHKESYDRMYDQVMVLQPVSPAEHPLQLVVETGIVEEDYAKGETYWDVNGLAADGVEYSLSITPWSKWLACPIHPDTLRDFAPVDILAQCLFEMSVHGFDDGDAEAYGRILEGRLADVLVGEEDSANGEQKTPMA